MNISFNSHNTYVGITEQETEGRSLDNYSKMIPNKFNCYFPSVVKNAVQCVDSWLSAHFFF